MTHQVTIDITDREKIFINPNNGNRITKLKGGTEIPNSSPHQTGVQAPKLGKSGGDKEKKEGESGNPEAEKVEDVSVDVSNINEVTKTLNSLSSKSEKFYIYCSIHKEIHSFDKYTNRDCKDELIKLLEKELNG